MIEHTFPMGRKQITANALWILVIMKYVTALSILEGNWVWHK
jgi:hypothetical protein